MLDKAIKRYCHAMNKYAHELEMNFECQGITTKSKIYPAD